MKKIIPFYLYPYFFKYIGLSLGIAGLLLLLILDPGYQLLFYFGLILVAFTKEKAESELVETIRAAAYKTVLGYFLALITVLYLMEVLYSDFLFPCSPAFLLGLPLILNILYFNLLLVLNRKKLEAHRKGIVTGYILWMLFVVIGAAVLAVKFLD